MNQLPIIRALFVLAGFYDALLGLAFVIAGPGLFVRMAIAPPNHWGYVHFPALLLIVFGLAFFAVARDPIRNRNLIPFGAMLKLCYSGTVFYYWFADNVPTAWKPFAFIDFLFLGLFLWAYQALANRNSTTTTTTTAI